MPKKILVLDESTTHVGDVDGHSVDVIDFVEEGDSIEFPSRTSSGILDMLTTELVRLLPAAQQIGTVGGCLVSVSGRVSDKKKLNLPY